MSETKIEAISCLKSMATLPGEGPWRIRVFNNLVIAVSPNAGAFIVYDSGKVEPLVPLDAAPVWSPDPHFGIGQCGHCGGTHGGLMCPKLTPIADGATPKPF